MEVLGFCRVLARKKITWACSLDSVATSRLHKKTFVREITVFLGWFLKAIFGTPLEPKALPTFEFSVGFLKRGLPLDTKANDSMPFQISTSRTGSSWSWDSKLSARASVFLECNQAKPPGTQKGRFGNRNHITCFVIFPGDWYSALWDSSLSDHCVFLHSMSSIPRYGWLNVW